MARRLISMAIMVVIGLALLPVVAGFTNDIQEGTEIEGTFSEESYTVDTPYDLDFDATEDNLAKTDITVDGTLLVENGEPVDENDTFTFADGVYTFEYVSDEGQTFEIDTDANTITFSGADWAETGGFEVTYIDYDEPSQAIQSLVGILPVIFVVMLITGSVVYIRT